MAEEKMGFKNKVWNLVIEYSQTSTIAGFHYIFEPKVTIIGKLIWLFLISLFTALGIYLSAENYSQWKNEPVITTLTSTGLPISKVDLPAVVICSQGYSAQIMLSAYYKLVFEYLEEEKGFVNEAITPLDMANIFLKRNQNRVNCYNIQIYKICCELDFYIQMLVRRM